MFEGVFSSVQNKCFQRQALLCSRLHCYQRVNSQKPREQHALVTKTQQKLNLNLSLYQQALRHLLQSAYLLVVVLKMLHSWEATASLPPAAWHQVYD